MPFQSSTIAPLPALRLADPATTERYPLPVHGEARWQAEAGSWRVTLALPEIPGGTILVPSLAWEATDTAASPDADRGATPASFRWSLTAGDACWALQAVPGTEPGTPPSKGSPVTGHVDCYHVHRTLDAAQLHLRVQAPTAPHRYLITVTSRPLTMAAPPLPARCAALTRVPTARSQMTAPDAIAQRICSPTCVSMVLDLWQRSHDWLAVTAECHDPVSGMYGVWPLALAAAARRGCLGAVEVFERWDEPLAVLERGIPLVTSVRFSAGELPGAPLTETAGHLIVVHAATPETIGVCDPAAPDGEVVRDYPAEAFSRAWLRHRGAAYILPP